MCCFLVLAKNHSNIHFKSTNKFTTISCMVHRYHLRYESNSFHKSQEFMCALLCFKEKVLSPTSPERGRNMANQWACHNQLTSSWKKLVFNHPLLPSSCGHLTSFAQGLSRPLKTPCCAVKAFEVAYASWIRDNKSYRHYYIRNTQENAKEHSLCVKLPCGNFSFCKTKHNYSQIWVLRILQDKSWPVLKREKGRKQRILKNIFKWIYIIFSTDYASPLLHRSFLLRLAPISAQVTLAAKCSSKTSLSHHLAHLCN